MNLRLLFIAKFTEEKEALEEHKKKLIEVIDACKLLYDNFDEKRREVGLHHKNAKYRNAKVCLF